MTRHEKAGIWAAAVLAAAVTAYSVWTLVGAGMLSWHIRQTETLKMLAEFLIVWLVLAAGMLLAQHLTDGWTSHLARPLMLAGPVLFIAAYSWLHMVFLPAALAGLYIGYLILAGRLAGEIFLKRKLGSLWAFALGSAVTISVFCLLSLAHVGSIRMTRFWVLGSGGLFCGWYVGKLGWKKVAGRSRGREGSVGDGHGAPARPGPDAPARPGPDAPARPGPGGLSRIAALAAIGALLLLQLGRMNVAVDFDSVWYGVRSHVMLDSGNSIYENLGTLGVVYTYSKGWEVLTLPLAGLPSYSFLIAFNWWTAVLVLWAAYETACVKMERGNALWVPFLMAAVPGIMNMACTAKADLLTLFFQILMIQSVLRYGEERQSGWLILGVSAALVSFTLKPTAVIYSTAIGGIAFIWVCWDYLAGRKNGRYAGAGSAGLRSAFPRLWLALVPAALALAGIWGRTFKLVGVPVTSVFYQLFQKLGFTVKYPFYASSFPSSGSGGTLVERTCFLFERLYGVLLNPQGDDMAHVVIAWGTALPLVLLIVWLCLRHGKRRGGGGAPGFLPMLTAAVLFINLISLYSLSQIDGNYYMLFYALIILTFCIWGEGIPAAVRRASRLVLLPAWAGAVLICALTNWAWALGNGGLHLRHKGYYDHTQAAMEQRAAQGSGAIWNILAADPLNRVIALGDLPGVLTFPCSVQSYIDVSGYWGNPEVVSTAADFLQYLRFADMDYLYMEKEYVCEGVRIYDIIRELVKEGWLYDVRGENGSLIISVRKDGPVPEGAQENLGAFDYHYLQHP